MVSKQPPALVPLYAPDSVARFHHLSPRILGASSLYSPECVEVEFYEVRLEGLILPLPIGSMHIFD